MIHERILLFSLLLFFIQTPAGHCQPAPGLVNEAHIQPGVSATLAAFRRLHIRNPSYNIWFSLPAGADQPIEAGEELTFEWIHPVPPEMALQLDFRNSPSAIHSLTINGRQAPVLLIKEHLLISPFLLQAGINTIGIRFTADNLSLNRNPDFLYTLLVPDRARTLFPCFDQPDCKARFTLQLSLPEDWQAISNAPILDSSADSRDPLRKVYRFRPTDPIPTYLFSFAAGRFRVQSGKFLAAVKTSPDWDRIRRMHLFYRETDSARLRLSMGPIFQIQAAALQYMETYTGLPYPFQKFDFIALPDFQFGGMEHPGAIQYKASSLFLPAGATREQLIARSNLLTHETAHMWFGDLVTMQWFNDVWMKEVFANFFADKIGNAAPPDNTSSADNALLRNSPSLPDSASSRDGRFELKFLIEHLPAAYSVDRTAGTHPIRQSLENLQDAGSLYGNIIYHKAPVMMRQLERLMGAKAFREGLRAWLKKYTYGNADWPALIRMLDAHTPANLAKWDQSWVEQPGRPAFSYTLSTTGRHPQPFGRRSQPIGKHIQPPGRHSQPFGNHSQPAGHSLLNANPPDPDSGERIKSLILRQQGEDASPRVWPQYFRIALVYADHVLEIPIQMNDSMLSVKELEGKPLPLCLLFNSGGEGYGLFPVDQKSIPLIAGLKSPLMRASAYINLYENMLNGSPAPLQVLELETEALSKEKEELTLGLLLDQVQSIYWRFLPPGERNARGTWLEQKLWEAMQDRDAGNIKKLLFKAYSNIATGKTAEDSLFTIWKTRHPPAGVRLSEEDYTGLATGLALRQYPGWKQILTEQEERISNIDNRRRLEWLLPSLSDEQEERDRFFASLKEWKNRGKESWVLMALGYLHHPLRKGASEKYLPESLDLLAEIHSTGGVFFPQSWLQATLGYYQDAPAADTVRKFLQDHPDYDPKLKDKILQSADNLFRAEKLLGPAQKPPGLPAQ